MNSLPVLFRIDDSICGICYKPTWACFLYQAVVIDAWSRRVVGWAMETHLRTELVLDALTFAIRSGMAVFDFVECWFTPSPFFPGLPVRSPASSFFNCTYSAEISAITDGLGLRRGASAITERRERMGEPRPQLDQGSVHGRTQCVSLVRPSAPITIATTYPTPRSRCGPRQLRIVPAKR